MKKVLFLIGSLQGGGAEKVLVDTVNSLNREKYQITVQTLFDRGEFKGKLSSAVRYKTIITCKEGLLCKIAAKLLFSIGTRLTYRFFVREDYDYEIAFLEGLPTKILSKSTAKKAKKIAWVHTDLCKNSESATAYRSAQKEGEAYDRFDRVICVSKSVEKAFRSKYCVKNAIVSTLYNIVDDAAVIMGAKEEVELPISIRPCFISVGRLIEQKGFDRLLRIHKRLIEKGYRHSLLIIGEGELRASLEKYIKDNNLEDTVCLLGFCVNPYKYISKADAFVSSSYVEGFSTVITESILCGTPVVATDVSGNREPEEAPRCSVIVENEENSLYESLSAIIDNPAILERYRDELPAKQRYYTKKSLLSRFEEVIFGVSEDRFSL